MKHRFKRDEDARASICEECGYVWGEENYRKCKEEIKYCNCGNTLGSETEQISGFCNECT
jgi:hypothetical protein